MGIFFKVKHWKTSKLRYNTIHKNPVHIDEVREDSRGTSQRFIGEKVTVDVNTITGVIITSWKTGKSKLRKYKQGSKYDE